MRSDILGAVKCPFNDFWFSSDLMDVHFEIVSHLYVRRLPPEEVSLPPYNDCEQSYATNSLRNSP